MMPFDALDIPPPEDLTRPEVNALELAARDRETLGRRDGTWAHDYATTDLVESALKKLRARLRYLFSQEF